MEILKRHDKGASYVTIKLGLELDDNNQDVIGDVELDIENQSKFVDVINAVFSDDIYNVLVDLDCVSYIDSSGLWALFEGHKKASQKDGAFLLLNPRKDVMRVLDITKVSSKMKIFSSFEEAVAFFA
eukprot:COSAG01_NODE_4_length_55812_cov_1344.168109_21_plen_127_part_00